ncbi:MAG: response regulator [Thermoproteota archaeon]
MSDSVDSKRIRILHVDDDVSFLRTGQKMLELQGIEVETVVSVEDALGKLKREDFDAVVSDYQMPGRNGLQFLQELRGQENDIPFVMFTGKGREVVAMRALNLGADRYLHKHGDPETVYGELAHSIKKAVNNRRMEEALRQSERKYRLLAGNITDVIFIEDMNFNIKYVTPSVERLFGYTPEEMLKLRKEEIMTPQSFERAVQDFREAVKVTEEDRGVEFPLMHYQFVRKDDSTFWGEVKKKLLRDRRGNTVGVQGTLREITQRKEAENKLRERYGLYLTRKMCEVYGWAVMENNPQGRSVTSSIILSHKGGNRGEDASN